jgi:hypothetical protein
VLCLDPVFLLPHFPRQHTRLAIKGIAGGAPKRHHLPHVPQGIRNRAIDQVPKWKLGFIGTILKNHGMVVQFGVGFFEQIAGFLQNLQRFFPFYLKSEG